MISDEGLIFTDPTILTDLQVVDWLHDNFPNASDTVISEMESLYPLPASALGRYITEFDRVKNIITGYSGGIIF
jgi:hypothetical protein